MEKKKVRVSQRRHKARKAKQRGKERRVRMIGERKREACEINKSDKQRRHKNRRITEIEKEGKEETERENTYVPHFSSE